MAKTRLKLTTILLGAAAAVGTYVWATHKKIRFSGDAAKVEDDVQVPITSLSGLPAAFPAGAGFVIIRVGATTSDQVSGFIIGTQINSEQPMAPTNPPVGPVNVGRGLITGVFRAGIPVA